MSRFYNQLRMGYIPNLNVTSMTSHNRRFYTEGEARELNVGRASLLHFFCLSYIYSSINR